MKEFCELLFMVSMVGCAWGLVLGYRDLIKRGD